LSERADGATASAGPRARTQLGSVPSADKISNWIALFLFGLGPALASCQKPIEPAVDAPPPVDALTEVQAIQREERRSEEQVMQLARTQAARELEYAAKVLASWESGESAGLDGGQPIVKAGGSGVLGKLERAEPDTLIIRDESGFEYWLKAGDTTPITYNGKPARLTDFKQGAEVRASFVWQGNQRVATEVEVLDAGQPLDGGRPIDAGIR
jgi:hypothetical protein